MSPALVLLGNILRKYASDIQVQRIGNLEKTMCKSEDNIKMVLK
jgi:hypothetical protein